MIDLIPIDESEPLDGAAAALAEQMALDLMLLRQSLKALESIQNWHLTQDQAEVIAAIKERLT